MGSFNRHGRSGGGGGGFGKRNFGGGRPSFGGHGGSGHSQMHPAVCGTCGKDCEVPFRPTNDRPVYCNDCFRDQKNAGGGSTPRSFDRPKFDRPSFGKAPVQAGNNFGQFKEQFDMLSAKMDKILAALTQANVSSAIDKTSAPVSEKVKKAEKVKVVETKVKNKSKKVVAKKKK